MHKYHDLPWFFEPVMEQGRYRHTRHDSFQNAMEVLGQALMAIRQEISIPDMAVVAEHEIRAQAKQEDPFVDS